jgi:1,4-dihydroxy-2-naphthoate octaprenyltransferase
VGPIRVTQAGLISPSAVLAGSVIAFALAALACAYLVYHAGFIILIIGIASILSGVFYTAGKRPLGYIGLGELFVFIFFGPVAVGGTYFVQSLDLNWAVVAAGFGPGLLSMAILAVNNLRDIQTDQRVGKMTLAVRFGRSFASCEYLFCILGVAITPFVVVLITHDHNSIVVSAVAAFLAIPLVQTVFTSLEGRVLNNVLAQTGRLLLIYSLLFSLGWILCSR